MDAIRIADLRFRYPSPFREGSPVDALCGVDLEINAGEFLALMGPVGAGKTTLCLALNGAIPHLVAGEFEGRVTVFDQDTRGASVGHLAMQVGLLLENAEEQLFNATVVDEIAFGLEAMGLSANEIERRVDDTLERVDLAGFRRRNPRTLSGGEQKRLALACVLAMQPRVLVLDEPTSGLDASGRFKVMAAVERLRVEQGGMTVIMATQDAEAAARFAGRIVVLRQGKIALSGTPAEAFGQIGQLDEWGLDAPQLARLAKRLRQPIAFRPEEAIRTWDPLTLRPTLCHEPAHPGAAPSGTWACPAPSGTATGSAAAWDQGPPTRGTRARRAANLHRPIGSGPLIEIRALCYEYPKAERPALCDVDMEVVRGEWLAVIGVNGSGKSTLLKHLNGLLRPTRGTVHIEGSDARSRQVGELARIVSYLPQNPDHSIFCATVRDEIAYGPRQMGLEGRALDVRVAETLELLSLDQVAQHPPAVLGYGLRRQVALASVLSMKAPVLALDEPATGLDRGTIARLMEVVSQRHRQGTTVIMISHDLQLIACYAQRVIIFFGGRLVAEGATHQVLSDVTLIRSVGLEPLPVTALAHALGWAQPLPLSVEDWGTR